MVGDKKRNGKMTLLVSKLTMFQIDHFSPYAMETKRSMFFASMNIYVSNV